MNREAFEKFVQEKLDWLRGCYERGTAIPCGEAHLLCLKNKETGEAFTEEKPFALICAIQAGDAEIRFHTQQMAKDNDAFAVMVKMEAWFAQVEEDADPALKERLRQAHETQTVDKLESGLRREKVIVHFESIEEPIRIFEAEIIREAEGEPATVKPWERTELSLPRPGFRRYLAEFRDGKKTMGLSVPGGGTIRLVYGDEKK